MACKVLAGAFRRRVPALPTLAALAVAACSGGTQSGQWTTVPETPEIATLSISPPVASFVTGQPITLRADAYDADGNYIWIEDYPEIGVSWEVPADGVELTTVGAGNPADAASYAFSQASGAETTITITATSVERVQVTVTANWLASRTIKATAFLNVSTAIGAGPSDMVTAIPTADPVFVLLDGCQLMGANAEKVFFAAHSFITKAWLFNNMTEGCGRDAQFAFLSRAHRAQIRDTPTLKARPDPTIWSNNLGDELRGDTLPWGPPDEINLHLHYFLGAGVPNPESAGQFAVAEANDYLRTNRLGIEFVAMQPDSLGEARKGACDLTYIEGDQGGLEIGLSDAMLHVAFVDGIGPVAAVGQACASVDTGAGRVIFVDWNKKGPVTLAHELGHVLSHEYPNLYADHVTAGAAATPGFTKDNLMHRPVAGVSRHFLTAGQVFRMNVDNGSWYQHEPAIGDRHPGMHCGCEPYAPGPCPMLFRDPMQAVVTIPTAPLCSINPMP